RASLKSILKPLLIMLLIMLLLTAGGGPVLAADEGGHSPAGAQADKGHGEGGAGGGLSAEKIWDFVYRVMNFGVLFVILFVVLRKPLRQLFRNRRERIRETLADLEQKKAEAEARFKEIEARLADLDAERQKIIADYVREGEREKENIISNARQMAERIQRQAQIAIAQEIKSAKSDLTKEIAEKSAAMAEELIKKNIDDHDQERLVEEYLDKVVRS
ncbi:MAG: F0F1 ATP synthase subunit B, partial [Pseudomonadota bacterium]